jgi:hypothetical protein
MDSRLETGRRAIQALTLLSNDELRELKEEIQPLMERFASLFSPPKEVTGYTAERLLNKANKELQSIVDFLKCDWYEVVTSITFVPGEDPQTITLSESLDGNLEPQYRRLLAVRSLRLDYMQSPPNVSVNEFVKKKQFNHATKVKNGLKMGWKFLAIETGTETPGVSVALLTASNIINQLNTDEVKRAIELLCDDKFPDIIKMGYQATLRLLKSQELYDALVL